MIYKGNFQDINNTEYTIKITTNGDSSSTTEVVLGATPIITEIETSENHIYKPCKYSSATISIVSNDYMFDVYSATAQQNKVELLQGNTIRWVGYTTPNLYNMGYECQIEELEIEAIDGLSTLQYYKYKPISGAKRIVKLIDIVDYLIGKCNCYTNYYISHNTVLSQYNNECLLSKLEISEQNFFDEDDEPMTMQEVLEEICRFINVSCVADGDQVYFLDYDAIKNGINTYYKFAVGNTSGTVVTLQQSKEITASDYAENNGSISLDNVYNKAIVVDSLYSFDSVIPSIWDDKNLALYMTLDFSNNWHYYEVVDEEHNKLNKHKCFFKYYSNKNYKSYYYDKNLNPVTFPPIMTYTSTQIYVGATIVRADFHKVESFDDIINDVSFDDYLLLHTHDTNKTSVGYVYLDGYDGFKEVILDVDDDNGVKLFELEVNEANPSFMGGNDMFLIIQGTYIYMDRESEMYIPQGYSNKDDDFLINNLWIKAKLQFGNYWWNGESWQTTECCFKLPFDNNNQTDHCINQSFPTKNTVTWDLGIEESGYIIPLPTNNVMTGKPTFTLYAPHRLDNSYRCDAVWLKDFDIKAVIATYDIDTDVDSDTEYSNEIDSDFVNEFEEEEFKICTWDNKEANYSAVAYNTGSYYQFLDTVYNKSTQEYLRCEQHLIKRLVNQYSEPSVILTLNLKNNIKLYATLTDNQLPNKTFIVDYISTDWRFNKAEIKLIEKK